MTISARTKALSFLLPLCLLAAGPAEPQITLAQGSTLLVGDRPGIVISGLAPGETIVVHAYRVSAVSVKDNGVNRWTYPLFHAFARFRSDSVGDVHVDRDAPIDGSYTGADPRGLLWSGTVVGRDPEPTLPTGLPDVKNLKPRTVLFVLERAGRVVSQYLVAFRQVNDNVTFTKIDTPDLVGVYAAPRDARRAPTLIYLHGSEGGDFESAARAAGLYASHGFATLAIIYFAWPYGAKILNVPDAFDNLPVERIATARSWLADQPSADVNRLGISGVSKGSEFALLAAATYPWIKSVVACVPTSVVWGSFGAPPKDPAGDSGFTIAGRPVPFIPYGDYAPVQSGAMSLAQRHVIDRRNASPKKVQRASIPVETSQASFLLIASGKDDEWPSLSMSQEIVERMQRRGKSQQVQLVAFPDAGHFVCDTGDSPTRYSPDPSRGPGGGDVVANGRAGGVAWDQTLAFFERTLQSIDR